MSLITAVLPRPAWKSVALAVLFGALLAGCAATPNPRPVSSQSRQSAPEWSRRQAAASASAEQVTLMALAMIGTPYRFGGTALGGFDCSGLSSYVYAQSAGIQLPRSASAQGDIDGKALRVEDLRTGDLVFFETVPRRISHVGIYVGEGRFVHAPSAGSVVRLERLDNLYWWPRFRFGKRVAAR